jgi:polyferredoxin
MTDTLRTRNLRMKRAVQVLFFCMVFFIVLSHYLGRQGVDLGWPARMSFHALCPFGAVETAGRLLLQGRFIPKTHQSNLWLFAGVSVSTLLFGAMFCGYLCPLGSVQEWVGSLGRKLLGRRYNRFPSGRLDRLLGYLRYGMFILIVVQTTRAVNLVFSRFDPYYALFHFWMGDVFLSGMLVLAGVMLLSLFVERPWCRWLCPFGALLGIIQRFAPWKVSRNREACTSCGHCSRACPMRIAVHLETRVSHARCNRCGSCIDACPRAGALALSLRRGGRHPLRRWAAVLLLVVLVAAPVLVARSAGLVQAPGWEQRAGKVLEISGLMTLGEAASRLGLDVAGTRNLLNLGPEVPESTRLIDLEDIDGALTLHALRELLTGHPSIE